MKTSILAVSSLILSCDFLSARAPEPGVVPSGGLPLDTKGEEVGIAANDGISVSGNDALVTRNGVSERLTKEMQLANGTRVRPDGSITLPDGTQISLKVDQVMTFEGVVRDVPPRVNPAPNSTRNVVIVAEPLNVQAGDSGAPTVAGADNGIPDGVVFYNNLAYVIHNGRASLIDSTLVPRGKILTNDWKLISFPATLTDFPPVNVQKGTSQQTRIGEPGTPRSKKRDATTGNGPPTHGFRK